MFPLTLNGKSGMISRTCSFRYQEVTLMKSLVFALCAVLMAASVWCAPGLGASPAPSPGPTLGGVLSDRNRDGRYDTTISLRNNGAELATFAGRKLWTWRANDGLTRAPFLLAQDDLNHDGTTDYVFSVATADGGMCGEKPSYVSQPVAVDGRTGHAEPILSGLEDRCNVFATRTYPTDQWNVGTVQAGPWGLAAFPMYATEGYVWRDGHVVQTLPFPSTAAFDQAYRAANNGDCLNAFYPLSGACYIPSSHTAQTVFVGDDLLTLTTARAFLYRPDGTPTADTSWISGERSGPGPWDAPVNSGRNYGYLRTFTANGRKFAFLLGGCSVWNARQAMLGNPPPTVTTTQRFACSIHRHLEQFEIRDSQIVSHYNRYYSYVGTDGGFENRLEVPVQTGTRVIYNIFAAGRWTVHMIDDPSRPDTERLLPGRYAWGEVGRNIVVSPAVGYAPEWRSEIFDSHGRVVRRVNGVPSLVQYPDTASSHFYDDLANDPTAHVRSDSGFGVFTDHGKILMRTRDGAKSWVAVS